ncbi:hypothetical protein B566_EDAN003752 [Ephemera danica]|nr:hypothetical protein B566_EDAN003752 [Ephemera danica]
MDSQSIAEARREARRRRILQNSDDRLRKIKGEVTICEPDILEQHSHNSNDAIPIREQTTARPEVDKIPVHEEFHTLDSPPRWQSVSPEEELPEAVFNSTTSETSMIVKLYHARVHIILLAIVVRMALLMDMGYIFGDRVLVPLLVVHLSLALIPGQHSAASSKNSGGLLGAALMLSGLTQSKAHGLLKTACTLKNLFTDLAFYIFSFVISHVLTNAIQA